MHYSVIFCSDSPSKTDIGEPVPIEDPPELSPETGGEAESEMVQSNEMLIN